MILVCMMAIAFICTSVSTWACSSAVISGKVTPDGRPLLWKNRETGFLRNHMAYVKGEKYDFVANVNSDNFPKLKEAWVGSNTAGFALMNTQSYNLELGDIADDDRGPKNGEVIYRALEICATVEDFCHFLDTIQKPSGIEANFGVIDAEGMEIIPYEGVDVTVEEETDFSTFISDKLAKETSVPALVIICKLEIESVVISLSKISDDKWILNLLPDSISLYLPASIP